MATENYETAIYSEVRKYVEKANTELGCTLPMPKVTFSNSMTTVAGNARRKNGVYEIRFSRQIIEMNDLTKFLATTVPHEVAHLCQYDLYNTGDHGTTFYRIMHRFGVQTPTRCHTYQIPESNRQRNTFLYKCPCGYTFNFSAVRHNRALRGTKYRHSSCGNQMHPVDNP